MKILILNNNSIDSNRSISIDLICQNLENVHSNLALEIDLVCNSLLVHEHVFLKTTHFREVRTSLAIDKLWKRKENRYDLIVGIGITGLNKLYYWAISGKKKASIGKNELKKYRKLGALDFETQIAEIILKKVIKEEQLFDLKPNVYLDEVKLKSTKKVINWLLQSNDQKLLDNSHKDLRRARSAPNSIIPTTTGATKSLGDVIPELKGKVEGISIRVPTPNVSLVEFVFSSKKNLSIEEINNLTVKELQEIARKNKLKITEVFFYFSLTKPYSNSFKNSN